MNRLSHIRFLILLTTSFLFACHSDNGESITKYPQQYITAQVNDTLFECFTDRNLKVYYSEHRGATVQRALHITVRNTSGNILKLDITGYDDDGTYTFSPDDDYKNSGRYVKNSRVDSPYWQTNIPGGSGSMTLRMLDNGYAEGSFSFTAYNKEEQEQGAITVEDGRFLIRIPGIQQWQEQNQE
ncbi:DUF6252 family protein [Sinomicrobium oceani]|uniref:DUF6252 family protein n=1 Tax=Sinomicrobium oceani TaxID=1150368 RepID=UPI00227A3DE1|nr:DUF6252 family protein [Sinomicrobium oceani]